MPCREQAGRRAGGGRSASAEPHPQHEQQRTRGRRTAAVCGACLRIRARLAVDAHPLVSKSMPAAARARHSACRGGSSVAAASATRQAGRIASRRLWSWWDGDVDWRHRARKFKKRENLRRSVAGYDLVGGIDRGPGSNKQAHHLRIVASCPIVLARCLDQRRPAVLRCVAGQSAGCCPPPPNFPGRRSRTGL
jgi:hypothetical protein